MESLTKKIYKIMKSKPNGYVFIYDDFGQIGKYDTIRKSFSRLEKDGKIKKVMAGMYYVPEYIKIINEWSLPSVYDVMDALSRKFGWRITPPDETILNKTNISNQVVVRCIYNTSGPSKTYKVDNTTLKLVHRDDNDTIHMPEKLANVVKTIKIIGKENFNEDHKEKLFKYLNRKERNELIHESKNLPIWIQNQIHKIYN